MAIGLSGSKYEDIDRVSYVSGVDLNLTTKFDSFYKRQMELFNLSVGRIFSNEALKKLINEKRPHFPTNFFMTTINSLAGNFNDNIPSLDYIPGTPDDEPLVDVIKDVNHYLLHTANDTNYEISKAFINAIIGNIAWLKQTPAYNREGDGIVKIESYNPFRIAFDTENFRRDLNKTKFLRDAGWYTPEEIVQIYAQNDPDLEEEIKTKCIDIFGESALSKGKRELVNWIERVFNAAAESFSGKDSGGYDINNLKLDRYGDFIDLNNNRLKAIDFFERRMIREMDLYDFASGQKIKITDLVKKSDDANQVGKGDRNWYDDSKLQLIRQLYPQSKVEEYYDERIYQTSTIPGLFIKAFEGEQDIQSKNYNYIPIVAYDHHPDPMELTGVVEQIAPKIKSYNLRENTLLTYLMRQTHHSWILTDKLAETHGKYFRSNEVGGIIQVPKEAVADKDYKRVDPPASIAGLERFAENDKEDWKILGGTRDSVQGRQETTGESGKLAAIRIQQSDLMHDHISKNAQAAYLMLTKNNLPYMKKYMTEPRMLRIIKNDADPYWLQINTPIMGKIVNDLSSLNMDVQISLSPFGKQAQEMQEQKSFNMANFISGTFGPQYVPLEVVIGDSTLGGKSKWISHINKVKEAEAQAIQQQNQKNDKQMQEDSEYQSKARILELQEKANQIIGDEIAKKTIGLNK